MVKKNKSFTLIELLVVIGIVVLLTAASIVGISASRTRRQTKTAAEKLKYVVSEAISQARNPDDTSFGLKKIQIEIYAYNDATAPNEVKVFNCFSDPCPSTAPGKVENTKLSFKALNGVYFETSQAPPDGNMTKISNSRYYFGVSANGNNIGQITDYQASAASPWDAVYMKVMNARGESASTDIFSVKAYLNTSLVVNEKIK